MAWGGWCSSFRAEVLAAQTANWGGIRVRIGLLMSRGADNASGSLLVLARLPLVFAVTFQITINANGEVTAVVDKVEAECRG